MGIVSDFVIAQPNEDAVVIEEAAPTRRWRGVETKGIGTIKRSSFASLPTYQPDAWPQSPDGGTKRKSSSSTGGPRMKYWKCLESCVSLLLRLDRQTNPCCCSWRYDTDKRRVQS